MKTKSLRTIAATLLSIYILGVTTSGAQQITENAYEDTLPSIKNASLVWQGKFNGNWEIFFYNTETQVYRQVTNNDSDDMWPETDGDWITWLGNGQIFVYDISMETTVQIAIDAVKTYVNNPPHIASGRIVWTAHEVTDSVEPGDIFLYDAQGASTTCLSRSVDLDGTLDDRSPRINAEKVTWVQSGDGPTKRFLYDLATDTVSEAPDGFVWEDNPQVDGPLQVFTAHDGTDREIFVRDTDQKTTEQITNNEVEDHNPCISGTQVAWVQGSGVNAEIHLSRGPSRCLSVDLDNDGDVDGTDLAQLLIFPELPHYDAFSEKFGMTTCQ